MPFLTNSEVFLEQENCMGFRLYNSAPVWLSILVKINFNGESWRLQKFEEPPRIHGDESA